MFITEEEGTARLNSLDNLINKLQLRKLHNGGRPKGRKNDTIEKKAEVAEDAIILGPTVAAEKHNTTISRASLLSNGIVTHSKGSDEVLAPVVNSKKEEIHNKALDLITEALESIDLSTVSKASEMASIAETMAKIAEKTANKQQEANDKPKVQVIVFTPRMKSEEEFDTIDI